MVGTLTGPALGQQTVTLNGDGVALVQSWVNNPSLNNGFIVSNYTGATDGLSLNSRNTSTPSARPMLTVTYQLSPAPAPIAVDQNPMSPLDVNDDGTVTSLDALTVINHLNAPQNLVSQFFGDVNGDGVISPLDVLVIINNLNTQAGVGQFAATNASITLRAEVAFGLSTKNSQALEPLKIAKGSSELAPEGAMDYAFLRSYEQDAIFRVANADKHPSSPLSRQLNSIGNGSATPTMGYR